MKLKLIRDLIWNKDNKAELLFEVDEEFLDIYRSETGDDDFDQESFNDWFEELVKYAIEGDDWIPDEE